MILIGRYLSPFVRRVGATLHHFGMEFEHRPIRAGGADQDEIRKSNPTGRVPVLILDDGEILADSAVIVDYLDYLAGPQRALMPQSGWERYRMLSLLSISTAAAEKVVAAYMERTRPEENQDEPSIENAVRQAKDGFEYLYLQPCYDEEQGVEWNGLNFHETFEQVRLSPEWRLSLQTHKWMCVE